jgi:small subunit ribosomal protein S15
MTITAITKKKIIEDHQTKANDTGSAEVQCAILTARIQSLTSHLKEHKKDHSCRRSLLILVHQRKSLLSYLKSKSQDRYLVIIKKLGLRR